jgi:hypothetical protein
VLLLIFQLLFGPTFEKVLGEDGINATKHEIRLDAECQSQRAWLVLRHVNVRKEGNPFFKSTSQTTTLLISNMQCFQ